MNQYRPGGFGLLPPVIKNLIIINGLLFLAMLTAGQVFKIDLNDILGLHYVGADKFNPTQYISYMFMHGDLGHIFFNMFALWMFGKVLENVWGPKRFLMYYLITGIGAGLIHTIVVHFELQSALSLIDTFLENPNLANLNVLLDGHQFNIRDAELRSMLPSINESISEWQQNEFAGAAKGKVIDFLVEYRAHYMNLPVVVGASGAVFGILLAFGMMFPNSVIYLYFAIPVKAKYFVILYGALELFMAFRNNPGDNVAHFAHLGGMLFGYFLIRYWKNKGMLY